ncbi:uncharacterized protein G2W53_032853 [Senna tora]|uniref:Uncharacterized protein n=1 Tax=Senna tora TaxID=362788 RepID=A0A834T162_9FABA|nr:uncharacterized protein G2W53_032853 [Senna tora]
MAWCPCPNRHGHQCSNVFRPPGVSATLQA